MENPILYTEYSKQHRNPPPQLVIDKTLLEPFSYVHIGDYYRESLKWGKKMLAPMFDRAIVGLSEHQYCDHIGDSYSDVESGEKYPDNQKEFTGKESKTFWNIWRKPNNFRKKPEPLIVYDRGLMALCLEHDEPFMVDINNVSFTVFQQEEETWYNAYGYICDVIEAEIIPKMEYKPILIHVDSDRSAYKYSELHRKCNHESCRFLQ